MNYVDSVFFSECNRNTERFVSLWIFSYTFEGYIFFFPMQNCSYVVLKSEEQKEKRNRVEKLYEMFWT